MVEQYVDEDVVSKKTRKRSTFIKENKEKEMIVINVEEWKADNMLTTMTLPRFVSLVFILCLHNQNLFVIYNNPEKRCPEFAYRRGFTLKRGLINKWDPYPSTNYDLKCDIYKYLNLSLCCLPYPFLFNLISYFSVNLYNDSCSILDPRSQRAGSYKFGAVIFNV